MARIGNTRTISDIEFVIDVPGSGHDTASWHAHGVECSRDRHRFSGQAYAFTIEVLQLKLVRSGRTSWHVMIVTEWWHSGDPSKSIRNTKWLKVIEGKASDVAAWMRRCRGMKAADQMPPGGR
jgi:hypothetical protein